MDDSEELEKTPPKKEPLPAELQAAMGELDVAIKNYMASLAKISSYFNTSHDLSETIKLVGKDRMMHTAKQAFDQRHYTPEKIASSEKEFEKAREKLFNTLAQFSDKKDQAYAELKEKYSKHPTQEFVVEHMLLNPLKNLKSHPSPPEKPVRTITVGEYFKEEHEQDLNEITKLIASLYTKKQVQTTVSSSASFLEKAKVHVRKELADSGRYKSKKDDKILALETLKSKIEKAETFDDVKDAIKEVRNNPKVMNGGSTSIEIAKLLKMLEKTIENTLKYAVPTSSASSSHRKSEDHSYSSPRPGSRGSH